MKELIVGSVGKYLTINTTEYNEDGDYSVIISDYSELEDLGWLVNESAYPKNLFGDCIKISDMKVGDILCGDNAGVYLMRIA